MKKLSLIVAGLSVLAGVAVQAANTNVTSVNAVGYVNVTLPASNKFIMVASNFEPISGATARTVLDIFGANSGLRQSTVPTKVDRVYIWSVPNQKYVVVGQKTNGLFYLTSNWAGAATNPVVPLGYGFFIQSPTAVNGATNDTTLTFAGQVPAVMVNPISIVGTPSTSPFQMLANPYPVSMTIDALINTNSGAKGAASPNSCDRVYLWDTASQKYITLGLKTPTNRWWNTSNWATTNMPVYSVDPGQGFWYQGKTNFTWNAQKPYQWP